MPRHRAKIFQFNCKTPGSLVEQSLHWIHLGAQIVGGCCRTRPAEIAALAQAIRKQNE